MEKLFDKDFFKFLAGFLFLLLISGVVAVGIRLYEKSNLASPEVPCVKGVDC